MSPTWGTSAGIVRGASTLARLGLSSLMSWRSDGVSPTRARFFHRLVEGFKEKAKLFTVEADGRTVGGNLAFIDDKCKTIRTVFGGVLEEYWKFNVGELLVDYAIR